MKKFFKTVAVVTVFSVSEKFLGFLYRIFLSRTIGAEGIGLYTVALSVFALLFTISASGTPVTVSRLMTKYKAEGKPKKVFGIISAGLSLTILIAIPLTAIFYIIGGKLSFIFADRRCLNVFFIVLPALTFNSVYAVFRGVFWGNKDFLTYSVIELLEEICMIVVGIVLILFAPSVTEGAYACGIAVLVSYLFSFTLATVMFFIRKNKIVNPKPEFKVLFSSAAPVTVMRTVSSLAVSVVSIILPIRLVAAGFSGADAMESFGAATGQAMPLLFIPTTLIGSFTLVLIPEISENFYKKRNYYLKRDIEKALKFTVLVSSLFIPVFFVLGNEIGVTVFDSVKAGEYLTASSFLMLFIGISNITTSMLNSMGYEKRTLIYYAVSGAFMLLSIWFLPKVCGVYALLIGFSFVYVTTSILNLRLLYKSCPIKPKCNKFIILSLLLVIPSALFGLMLEKMLILPLGTFATLIVVSILTVTFHVLSYAGFGLINTKSLLSKIKTNIPALFKRKSRQ